MSYKAIINSQMLDIKLNVIVNAFSLQSNDLKGLSVNSWSVFILWKGLANETQLLEDIEHINVFPINLQLTLK